MKLDILIFSYNGGRRLDDLISQLLGDLDLNETRVLIADDGSDLSHAGNLEEHKSQGVAVILTRPAGSPARKEKAFGQIEGLGIYLEREAVCGSADYVWLLDFDYRPSDAQEIVNQIKELKCNDGSCYELLLLNLRDLNEGSGRLLGSPHGTRTVDVYRDRICWPSVVPTSGIVLNVGWVSVVWKMVNARRFGETWLDARIQFLACVQQSKCERVDAKVYRIIHGRNDSSRIGFRRRLRKWAHTYGYWSYVLQAAAKANHETGTRRRIGLVERVALFVYCNVFSRIIFFIYGRI